MEVIETGQDVKVEAELPGMDEKDIEILLRNGVLTIRGERQSESEDKYRRVSERYYGQFERRIVLPAEVEGDRATASLRKGLLTVTLPKTARERLPSAGRSPGRGLGTPSTRNGKPAEKDFSPE